MAAAEDGRPFVPDEAVPVAVSTPFLGRPRPRLPVVTPAPAVTYCRRAHGSTEQQGKFKAQSGIFHPYDSGLRCGRAVLAKDLEGDETKNRVPNAVWFEPLVPSFRQKDVPPFSERVKLSTRHETFHARLPVTRSTSQGSSSGIPLVHRCLWSNNSDTKTWRSVLKAGPSSARSHSTGGGDQPAGGRLPLLRV